TGLTKRYGRTLAVDGLSFEVRPGRVTGFLGPNGAGKTTTMRLILGLDAPTRGAVTVDQRPYPARGLRPGRRVWRHLWSLARSNRIGRKRVDKVLGLVGLSDVARRRVGPFSLG